MQVTRSDFEHALETDIKPVSYNCYIIFVLSYSGDVFKGARDMER